MKYFDYAASCPLDRDAADTYIKAATLYYGNSQSLHDIGSEAHTLLENCRNEWAQILEVAKEGIYFTSGGSESNFLAIHSLLSASKKPGKHIITAMAEHSSIRSTLEKFRKEKHYEITAIPFLSNGLIDVEKLSAAIREDTVLITIQHANPEIGSIQPLEEISTLCKANGILVHSDGVHSFGKTDIKHITPYIDGLSISGHKFYGPKGIGTVYVNPRLNWRPFYPGVSHEGGFRFGTVNVPAIAAMTVAAHKTIRCLEENTKRYKILRETFLQMIEPIQDKSIIYSADDKAQLPSTIGMRIIGLEGHLVMLACNQRGFAISTGSACQVGSQGISKTMMAMGITGKAAKEFIRISFGTDTSVQDTRDLGEAIVKIVQETLPSYVNLYL